MSSGKTKFGIALGGGAARGIAHVGVLKVLQENDLEPDLICGTSAGSAVAALYAGGYRWETILEVVRALEWGNIVKPVFPRMGLVNADGLEKRLTELLEDLSIEELEIPFCAVAVDLMSQSQVVICEGSVARAVRASCSIPGIFEPVIDGDQMLVDGGLLNEMPIDVARDMGADVILGVDLNSDLEQPSRPENVFQVLMASFAVMSRKKKPALESKKRTFVVQPDLTGFNYHDLKRADDLIARGEEAAEQVLPQLKKMLRR